MSNNEQELNNEVEVLQVNLGDENRKNEEEIVKPENVGPKEELEKKSDINNMDIFLFEKYEDEKKKNEDIKKDYEEEKKETERQLKNEKLEKEKDINKNETKIEIDNINKEDIGKWELR